MNASRTLSTDAGPGRPETGTAPSGHAGMRFRKRPALLVIPTVTFLICSIGLAADEQPVRLPAAALQDVSQEPELTLAERRLQFQSQELMLAKSGGWIFMPGNSPRIIWRDVEEVRRLAGDVPLRVRWFNSQLQEFPNPGVAGRWMAWIEGTAPNGTPLRRAMTFYAVPSNLVGASAPDLSIEFPRFPGPNMPTPWKEHRAEFERLASDMLIQSLVNSEQGAILIAGVAEAEPLGRPARSVESASVRNDDLQLSLKLKLQGLEGRARELRPPGRLESAATVLHEGTAAEAGVLPDAHDRIEAVCREWAQDSAEPFVTLVARRGVIVIHAAFGQDADGQPIGLNERCWVASITKTVTALMFSQFVDQKLISLDDSLARVFPDYPLAAPFVPTFRQCLNHTSGLTGHGEYGGMKNPHLENVILNGLDVNQPNSTYRYCGLGFELVAKAMEILAGKSAARIYSEHLFVPLEFGDVEMGNASSDGKFTAIELAKLAQWVANRGRYGSLEFISPGTFDQLLPQPIDVDDRGYSEDEGMGIHWVRHLRSTAAAGSKRPEDLLFSPGTLGHGSFSGCVFLVDPEQQLVITQVRRQTGPRHAQWSAKFYQTIAECIR